ncbi:hypothetical protein [Rhodococcus opacus]|uniref:hypothetical protein n=1 Tax=Rhodococcus opacus TaxID=37919 RepID=UPI0029CA2E63|nr:hypothetical protein [Rhodococcus opacus]
MRWLMPVDLIARAALAGRDGFWRWRIDRDGAAALTALGDVVDRAAPHADSRDSTKTGANRTANPGDQQAEDVSAPVIRHRP